MPVYLSIELVAVALHCVYGFISFGIRNNMNVNVAVAQPMMQGLCWIFATLYITSLVTAAFEESVMSIVICIAVGVFGAAVILALINLGLIAAILTIVICVMFYMVILILFLFL